MSGFSPLPVATFPEMQTGKHRAQDCSIIGRILSARARALVLPRTVWRRESGAEGQRRANEPGDDLEVRRGTFSQPPWAIAREPACLSGPGRRL